MPRPRRYPELKHEPPHLSRDDGRSYQPARLTKAVVTENERRFFTAAKHAAWPTMAGYHDPLAIMCITDLLLRTEADSFFTAKEITWLMTTEYRNLRWRPIVVGRILSDLSEAAVAVDDDQPPIERLNGQGGNRYAIHVNEINWRWLLDVRNAMWQMYQDAITAPAIPTRTAFPFAEIAALTLTPAP